MTGRGLFVLLGLSVATCGEASADAPSGKPTLPQVSTDNVLLQLRPKLAQAQASNDEQDASLVLTEEEEEQEDEEGEIDGEQNPPPALLEENGEAEGADRCQKGDVARRRRTISMCSCRRRHSNDPDDASTGWSCQGRKMKRMPSERKLSASGCPSASCLCVFDIDRTLTGKQSRTERCPRNRELDIHDDGYGGGKATLSALANEGLNTTFCNACYLGITSAGKGSGEHSDWNRYVLDEIMRGEQQDNFTSQYPDTRTWSYRGRVESPFVLGYSNRKKQNAVDDIRQWYGERGACIDPSDIYFFGDRTENIEPFKERGFNSREISCGSRDRRHKHGMIGYCGATPEEIRREPGNILCEA